MSIRYNFLNNVDFDEIYKTHVIAFSDYHMDMSYMTRDRSWLRNIKSGVHYDYSVGAFDGEKLVGFTFVGLDDWKGELAAFDAGTGIVKEYRGQGIAGAMFEHALSRLKERGVSRFLLEVLVPNEAAISAYTKTGFQATRRLACYHLNPVDFASQKDAECPFEIEGIDRQTVQAFKTIVDWHPSWENSFSGMDRIPDELIRLGAFDGEKCVGILVYYPLLSWIMTLVVKKEYRRQGVASSLFAALMRDLPRDVEKAKINNIDHGDKGMIAFFEGIGSKWVIDQFEMEYRF